MPNRPKFKSIACLLALAGCADGGVPAETPATMKKWIFRTDSDSSTVTMTNTRYSDLGRLWYHVNLDNITTSNDTEYRALSSRYHQAPHAIWARARCCHCSKYGEYPIAVVPCAQTQLPRDP